MKILLMKKGGFACHLARSLRGGGLVLRVARCRGRRRLREYQPGDTMDRRGTRAEDWLRTRLAELGDRATVGQRAGATIFLEQNEGGEYGEKTVFKNNAGAKSGAA